MSYTIKYLKSIKFICKVLLIVYLACLIYGFYKMIYQPSEMYKEILLVGERNKRSMPPNIIFGVYEFDQYATNVDRYRGYGSKTFNRVGFNPLGDNEVVYNANTSGFQDFKRMMTQFNSSFNASFLCNVNYLIRVFNDSHSEIYSFEALSEQQFEKAMKLGLSTRGGFWEYLTNGFLYSAFPYGHIVYWILIPSLFHLITLPLSLNKKIYSFIILVSLFLFFYIN